MTHKSPTQPLCHYCGKPIAKYTDRHHVRDPGQAGSVSLDRSIQGPLYSKAECQQKVNGQVVHVSYSTPITWDRNTGEEKPAGQRHIINFHTWDGESYADEFFCSSNCAVRLGYLMARAGRCTTAYNEAKARRNAKRLIEEQRREEAQ